MASADAPSDTSSAGSGGDSPRPAVPIPRFPPPPPEPEQEEGRMGILEHIDELRRRLMYAVYAVVGMMFLTLIFFKPIWDFLMRPVEDINYLFARDPELRATAWAAGVNPNKGVVKMISTDPLGTTFALGSLAFWLGLVLSAPIVLYQVWRFVAPGLKKFEQHLIRNVLVFGVLVFFLGAEISYFYVFPLGMDFLVWFDLYLLQAPQYSATHYVSLLIMFCVIFGLMFEIPVVCAALARMGLLKPEWLTMYWRGTVLGCFIVGAIISPGNDLVSYSIFAGFLLILWLLSVLLAHLLYPREKRKQQS